MVTDVPVDSRPVVVRVRRLVCPVLGCRRQTFRERIAGLLERHQRRTVRLAGQISQVARELCGRAAARLAGLLAVPVSRSTALRHLRRLPVPQQAVPQVIGVDDFALRRRHRYATIITDAETGRRVAVLPDREAATPESWLREHGSGVAVSWPFQRGREGGQQVDSLVYAAVDRGDPDAEARGKAGSGVAAAQAGQEGQSLPAAGQATPARTDPRGAVSCGRPKGCRRVRLGRSMRADNHAKAAGRHG